MGFGFDARGYEILQRLGCMSKSVEYLRNQLPHVGESLRVSLSNAGGHWARLEYGLEACTKLRQDIMFSKGGICMYRPVMILKRTL